MDYDSDSSDFHFPSDTGLPKLSSPLSFKVQESRDWALDEFMQTLSEKPCMENDNLTSFKQYIPIHENDLDDDFNYGPPKLTLPTYEEKDFLTQISQHFIDLERKELHDILKGGFSLVQNDIQTNTGASPFASSSPHPDITWFDEAIDYGYNNTNIISNLEDIQFKRSVNNFSPFDQHQSSMIDRRRTELELLHDEDIEEEEEEMNYPIQPIEFEKPLPPLPTTTVITPSLPLEPIMKQDKKKKKGLRYKIKSKLYKTFNKQELSSSSNTSKPLLLQKTKHWMSKIFT